MTKRHLIAVRFDDYEYSLIKALAEELGSMSEAIRRSLLTVRVLYDDDLTLNKAFKEEVQNRIIKNPKEAFKWITLADALKPIPQLIKELKLATVENRWKD